MEVRENHQNATPELRQDPGQRVSLQSAIPVTSNAPQLVGQFTESARTQLQPRRELKQTFGPRATLSDHPGVEGGVAQARITRELGLRHAAVLNDTPDEVPQLIGFPAQVSPPGVCNQFPLTHDVYQFRLHRTNEGSRRDPPRSLATALDFLTRPPTVGVSAS